MIGMNLINTLPLSIYMKKAYPFVLNFMIKINSGNTTATSVATTSTSRLLHKPLLKNQSSQIMIVSLSFL